MGWLISEGASRRDTIRRRTTDWTNSDGINGHCLKKSLRGNVLWTVWEIRRPDGTSERYIGCDLLGTDGCGNWGYKDIEESMGPCDLTCPVEYFNLVPPANPEWRAQVLASRFRGSLKVGDRVRLKPGYSPNELTIVSVKPLRGKVGEYGSYRFPRRAIAEVLTTPTDSSPISSL